jgi:hypothetical protein
VKHWIVLPVLLLSSVSAAAAVPSAAAATTCIDVHRSYEAHTDGLHDVIIRNSIGKPRPPLRLATTCVNLDKADAISVSSDFGCVSMGDTVVATKIDGHREVCRISRVAPYSPPVASPQP